MDISADDFAEQVSGVAALQEPLRRKLYLYVAGQRTDVSRDDASAACKISRALAAFHLDKMVDEGLLEATYRRLSGRTGPGAGRPTKLYRRSSRQISVNLPPRSYELAAKLFAGALADPEDVHGRVKLGQVARQFGETAGLDAATAIHGDGELGDPLGKISTVLGAYGYEPYQDEGAVRLRNCPFHELANEHRDLVCAMNLQLMDGIVDGLGIHNVSTVLDPRSSECCVAFRCVPPPPDTL